MEKKNYQFINVSKKGENSYNVTLKAWVLENEKNKPKFGKATIGGVEKDTCNFTVNGTYAKSKIKFLGLPEGDTTYINCSALAEHKEGISTVVDRLKKVNIRKGHMLLLVGTLVHKTNSDGKTYSTLYVDDFDVELRPKTTEKADVESEDIVEMGDDGEMPF